METHSRFVTALFVSWLAAWSPASAEEEVDDLLARLLAAPTIRTEPGFTAEVIVPPGQLYDPLWLHPRDGTVWLNDDGGEKGDKGSRIVAVGTDGTISELIGLGRLLPVTGYGVAPASFGEHAGDIFALTQAKVAAPGATLNHVIQRVDPASQDDAVTVCTLKEAGSVNRGVSGFGVDARFGPTGSPFADRFFAVTGYNNTIYQLTQDSVCSPFVTFDGGITGAPFGLAFSADAQWMYVTLKKGGVLEPPRADGGMVVRVSADGTVDTKPVVKGLAQPMGITRAPDGFASYGGQLFISDVGDIQAPVPMTQALKADGRVYRATADGALHLVASGFQNPVGLRVIDGALWVTDINGDFIAGKRELPDGFIVRLTPSSE